MIFQTSTMSCHVNYLLSTLHCIHPADTMSRDITEAAVLDPFPATAGKLTPQARLVGKVGFFGPRVSTHSFAAVQISSYNGREMAGVCCWCEH